MRHGIFILLTLLGTIVAGCSKTVLPEAESIPSIPPGRSNTKSADSVSQGQLNHGPMPAHPKDRQE
jgi:hypothetical protein